jgi:outer membrane protein assembly factor BamB
MRRDTDLIGPHSYPRLAHPLRRHLLCSLVVSVLAGLGSAYAADCPQWGQPYSRNMISTETALADRFDPETGENIKWTAPLGNQTWATPIISGGKVFIGTNNENPRDPRHKGDRGVLLCLNESDGSLCWQLIAPKLSDDRFKDWPKAGMVSPPTVEGDRVYMVTNRNEVMCLDLHGLANGNDGPYRDEARRMVPLDTEPLELQETDADVLWLYDIPSQLDLFPHDSTHCSVLVHGQFLYINTNSGLKGSHQELRNPEAPSLIVLDKATGRLIAQDDEGIGPKIFHSTWSSPALAEVNGQTLIVFCGGDGVVYAFEPIRALPSAGTVTKLKRIWRFDCDPTAPKENVHEYIRNRQVSPSNIKSMPVFYKNRVYVTVGGDIWWGKEKAWLKCIDATGTGDITDKGELWSYPVQQHCCSTPAIWEGLAFVADCGRYIHCVDAETGKPYWTHESNGEIWASTLVADGKVYVGTRRRDFLIMAAGKEKKVLSTVKLDSPIAGTATAANGVVYIPTMKTLYAVQKANR